MDEFDLAGKVALVTGASEGGLGYHCAVALARHGADVVVVDIPDRERELQATRDAVEAVGRRAGLALADVTNEEEVDKAITLAMAEMGHIDILVHMSGVMLRKSAIDTDPAEWRRIIDVNLTGTWLVNRRVGREMMLVGKGKMINTSTLYTNIVGPLPESAYYASKAGVANLSRGLAMEWGPAGINVNCIAPGVFYPTRMTAPLREQPDRLEWMEKRTMLGRLGNPVTDLPGVVVFLSSAASDYLTGQVICVDGGWTAW